MNLQWIWKSWDEISADEVYEILALRIRVFVVEQNCPYPETDGKDKKSLHLFVKNDAGECIACLRLVKPGVSYEEWSIGRVCTDMSVRQTGIGRKIMAEAMKFFMQENIPAVRISAQSYLKKFYSDFGFLSTGKEYLEDNIPHTEMLWKNPSVSMPPQNSHAL